MIDHDVFGSQVLVQHLQPVKRAQAFGDLFDHAAHGFKTGPRVVDHPLRQGLAFYELGGDINEITFAGLQARLEYMRAADAPGDPFLSQKPFNIGSVCLQVYGRGLEDDQRAGLKIGSQVNMAAAAAMQLTHDLVTVKVHSCVENGRQWQAGELLKHFAGSGHRQSVNPDELDGQVVGTAIRVGRFNEESGGAIKPVRAVGTGQNDAGHGLLTDMFIDTVGCQKKNIAYFNRLGLVVNLELGLDAQRTAEIAFALREPDAVVSSQLL